MKWTIGARRLTASARLRALSLLVCAGCSGTAGAPQTTQGIVVSPSSEVRQGQASITLSLGHAAGGLANPSHVQFDDLVVAVDPSSTDDHLLLTITVPHGAPPGPRTLTFDSASGATTESDVIDVTPITVGPEGQDSKLGTTNSPFRSLKQALLVAGPGDTCLLRNGAYAAISGETWPYAVPEQLTITGESANAVLQGPGAAAPGTMSAHPSEALQPSAGLTLENLSLADFDVAVDLAQPAQLSLKDVAIRGGGKGIVVVGPGSSVKLSGGSIDSATYGVELGGACDACSLDINGTTLTESGKGPIVQVSETTLHSQLTIEHAQFHGGIFVDDPQATLSIDASNVDGSDSTPGLNFGGKTLSVTSSTFHALTAPYGIGLRAGTMSLADVTVQGNQYSVYQIAGTSKLRNTKLNGYSSIGFYFAKGDLDLGTAADAGDNTFLAASSTDTFGIYVDTDTSPLSCSNTSFDGVFPPAGVVQAGLDDLLTQPEEYILTPGKTIAFFSVP